MFSLRLSHCINLATDLNLANQQIFLIDYMLALSTFYIKLFRYMQPALYVKNIDFTTKTTLNLNF